MGLAAQAEGVIAADVERVAIDRAVAEGVACRRALSSATCARPTPPIMVAVPVK